MIQDKIIGYAKGEEGKAATVSVGKVTTLQPTQNASVNNSGNSSDAILDFGIPKGNPGKDATVMVGAVHTLQPGEAATVKNTGTATAAVFDFGIPRGDDGITDLVAEYRADWSHTCTPTVAAPVVIKEIAGKTEQVQTTGAQLADFYISSYDANYGEFIKETGTLKQKSTLGNTEKSSVKLQTLLNGNFVEQIYSSDLGMKEFQFIKNDKFDELRFGFNGNNKDLMIICSCNNLVNGSQYVFSFNFVSNGVDAGVIEGIMLNAGTTALPWEPYTGGKPGPNPDYPQDIRGIGDSGQLVVESQGRNLIDFEEWSSKSPITRGTAVFNKDDKSVTLTASADDCYTEWNTQSYTIQVKTNTAYTLSWEYSGSLGHVYLFRNGLSNSGVYTENNAKKIKIVTESTTAFLTFRVGARTANTTCKYWNIQLQEGDTVTPYQPYHHTTATIPLSSPLYSGDKICCVHPGESYVDVDGKAVVAHRVLWGVRRERVSVMFDGSADENWVYANSSRQFHILPTPEPIGTESTKENAYSSFFRNGNISERNEGNSNNIIYNGDATPRNFLGIQSDKWTTLADFKAYLQSHPIDVVYKLAAPYFEPFTDQSPFHSLLSADDLTYIYTDDALKPEITVDVAKQAAGGYLLSGYMDREDGIMVDKTTGAECVLGMEDGLLTVYEIEED